MGPVRDDLSPLHQPVMVPEVLGHLLGDAPAAPFVVDGTVGLGGHAAAILDARPTATLLGLDRDGEALRLARRRLEPYGARAFLVHASYADLAQVLDEHRDFAGAPPWGVLLDLGASSPQLDQPERGFTFRGGSSGDMRFDRSSGEPTALDLANGLPEAELSRVLHEYGEEPRARAVARALVRARPLDSGDRLVEVVRRHALRTRRHDPATRSLQALRIAVNDEMGHLERGLEAALLSVAPGGRVVVISFHSGEDRRVKEAFRRAEREGRGTRRSKKPERPTAAEAAENRRARPARLRAFERAPGTAGDGETGREQS